MPFSTHRFAPTGVNIASLVFTDSAEDCNTGERPNIQQVRNAFAAVTTTFPKYVYSKRDMQYDQYQLTGNCMRFGGHTIQPLNKVMANRWYNVICNPTAPSSVFEPNIPACMDMGDSTNTNTNCFGTGDGRWMGNVQQVCLVNYLQVANVAPEGFCAATDISEENTTPLPFCPQLDKATIASLQVAVGADGGVGSKDNVTAFTVMVYLIFFTCLFYVIIESVKAMQKAAKARKEKPALAPGAGGLVAPAAVASGSTAEKRFSAPVAPVSHDTRFEETKEEKEEQGGADIENGQAGGVEMRDMPPGDRTNPGSPEVRMSKNYPDTSEAVPAYDPSLFAAAHPGADATTTQPDANNQPTAAPGSRYATAKGSVAACLCAYFSYPIAAQSDRFEALGFARFLASVHIVLGHMYQASHLGSFHNFNKFGFTWVPWFFLLSGYILTHTEKRRRDRVAAGLKAKEAKEVTAPKSPDPVAPAEVQPAPPGTRPTEQTAAGAAAASGAGSKEKKPQDKKSASPMGLVEYVLHRLRTLYPLYLVGIAAAIITVWAIKGASQLPPPCDVLVYFLLLQGWIPSILEYGLVYLVQCWFLSCMLFYWVLFLKLYEILQGLSDKVILGIAFVCSILLPFIYEMATFSIDWTSTHNYLSTDSGVDVAVVVLKFTPLAYLHIFVLGCCLPRVRAMLLGVSGIDAVLPWICTMSYLILFVIFITVGDEVPGYLLSFRLGLVSIVQCALLVGLCNSQDLLGRLFTHPFFQQFGLYSFAQYVFQFIVYAWFNYGAQQDMVDIRFFLLLFSTSVVVWTAVTPFNGDRMKSFVLACIPVLVIYLMLQPFLASYHKGGSDGSSSFPSWQNDQPLAMTVSNDVFSSGASILSLNFLQHYLIFVRVSTLLQVTQMRPTSSTPLSSPTTASRCSQRAVIMLAARAPAGLAPSTDRTAGRRRLLSAPIFRARIPRRLWWSGTSRTSLRACRRPRAATTARWL
jgi:peptidoglycan/LPS O-acetylase OafA/YrhL